MFNKSSSNVSRARVMAMTSSFIAVMAASSVSAEHCFSPDTTWLEDANTATRGYWKFLPSPGPMGVSAALPITCLQQNLRFVENANGRSIAFEDPQSAAAEKCFNVIHTGTQITWESGWQDEIADWGLSLRAGQFSRLFAIKCSIHQGKERKIHLSSQLIPGKSGRVEYVWRQTQ